MINVTTENGFEYPLDTIVVDGEIFDKIGYEMLETANSMTYVESPSRANSGAMYIEEMDSFIVPQCKVGFKLIDTERYIALKRLLLERKEHVVNYFDVDFGERVTHKMYVEADSLKKFFSRGSRVIGVQNYSVNFIGLNTDDEQYSVQYNANGGTEVTINEYNASTTYSEGDIVRLSDTYYRYINKEPSAGKTPDSDENAAYWQLIDISVFSETQTVAWGEPVMVEDCEGIFAPPAGKNSFLHYANKVNADGSMADGAWTYFPGQSLSVFRDTTLYAIWG